MRQQQFRIRVSGTAGAAGRGKPNFHRYSSKSKIPDKIDTSLYLWHEIGG